MKSRKFEFDPVSREWLLYKKEMIFLGRYRLVWTFVGTAKTKAEAAAFVDGGAYGNFETSMQGSTANG